MWKLRLTKQPLKGHNTCIMFNLPLFPLNTVLFPGMPLNLHIFEPRYQQMIRWCLDMDQPFGVILIRQGAEAGGPLAEPHEIGTTARIIEVENLEEGRMNIVALGETRFRVLHLIHDLPYLVGEVEVYPFSDLKEQDFTRLVLELRPWIERYMEILTSIRDINLDPTQLPRDPVVLTYLAAVLLQLPADQKQDLLASATGVELVSEMQSHYRREVALLRTMLMGGKPQIASPFSKN
jgi:uncharacterized protein